METITSIERTENNAESGDDKVTLSLGKTYGKIGALCAFARALYEDLNSYVVRHANGYWGEVDEHGRQANEYAVKHGLRVLSPFSLSTGAKIWIVIEADRSVTTILLPEEY